MSFQIKPIGIVRTNLPNGKIQKENYTEIIINIEFEETLDGIDDFSHLIILFYFHQLSQKEPINLKVHPEDRQDLPLIGILATRSPFRPTPIGLTIVELIKKEGRILTVRGLDAFDETPVLDIKPYDSIDHKRPVKVPVWWNKLHKVKSSKPEKISQR